MTISAASPQPRRFRHYAPVGLGILFFGVAAGPVAWLALLILNYGIVSQVCFANTNYVALWLFLLILDIAIILLSLSAALASRRNYRVAGETDASAEIARRVEGRSRFLAGWGEMAALGFCAAALLETISLFIVPSCLR